MQSSRRETQARPRARSVLIAVSSFLAVVAALATLSTSCGGSTTTTYTDPIYGFSFDYQASWRFEELSPAEPGFPDNATKSLGVYDPHGSDAGDDLTFDYISVDLYEVEPLLGLTIEDLREDFEGYLSALEDAIPTLDLLGGLTRERIGGLQGLKASYNFTGEGTSVRTDEYWLLGGDFVYNLYVSSSEDNWERNAEIFATFLSSFSPGKDTPDTTEATEQ